MHDITVRDFMLSIIDFLSDDNRISNYQFYCKNNNKTKELFLSDLDSDWNSLFFIDNRGSTYGVILNDSIGLYYRDYEYQNKLGNTTHNSNHYSIHFIKMYESIKRNIKIENFLK